MKLSKPKGPFECHRAEGRHLMKIGKHQDAVNSFSTALMLVPGDSNCLAEKSKCHLMLGQLDEALQDAEASLVSDRTFGKGLYQKAEVLYERGDLEQALILYNRGENLRPNLRGMFQAGIVKTKKAILSAIGDSRPSLKKCKASNGTQIEPCSTKGTKRKSQDEIRFSWGRFTETLKDELGELYQDTFFLKSLLRQTGLSSDIYDMLSECLQHLDITTDVLHRQKQRKQTVKRKKKTTTTTRQMTPKVYLVKQLQLLESEQSNARYRESLQRAKKCLKTLNGYSEGTIQNKNKVTAHLHSYFGNAYMEMGQSQKALRHFRLGFRFAKSSGNEDSVLRAVDNLGRVYARMGMFSNAMKIWSQKLGRTQSMVESAWLQHEIGRCHLELGHTSDALRNGENALLAARNAEDATWQIHAAALVAQAHAALGNYEEAVSKFTEALNTATAQRAVVAVEALEAALNAVRRTKAYIVGEHKTH